MFSLLYCKKAIKICATLQALSLLNQPLYYYPGSLRIYPFCQQARTAPTGRSILRAGLSTHAILLSDFIAGCPVQGSEGVCLQARTKQAIRQPARSAGCHPAKTNTTHAVAHRQPHSPVLGACGAKNVLRSAVCPSLAETRGRMLGKPSLCIFQN